MRHTTTPTRNTTINVELCHDADSSVVVAEVPKELSISVIMKHLEGVEGSVYSGMMYRRWT